MAAGDECVSFPRQDRARSALAEPSALWSAQTRSPMQTGRCDTGWLEEVQTYSHDAEAEKIQVPRALKEAGELESRPFGDT